MLVVSNVVASYRERCKEARIRRAEEAERRRIERERSDLFALGHELYVSQLEFFGDKWKHHFYYRLDDGTRLVLRSNYPEVEARVISPHHSVSLTILGSVHRGIERTKYRRTYWATR